MEFRDLKNFEGIYAATEDGQIWSCKRKKFMKISNGNSGYQQLTLRKDGVSKTCYLHRLIAQTFLDNPDNLPEVNHKDENKKNNAVSNLEWCDTPYNRLYGTRVERIANTRINNQTKSKLGMLYCIELDKYFFTQSQAEKELNIPHGTICGHIKGRLKKAGGYHWKYILEDIA